MVDNVSGIGGMGDAQASQQARKAYELPEVPRGQDEVALSSDVMKLRGMPGINFEKVMEVRKALAEGTYLTPEKLDKALDRAIDDAARR
jgi:anti-sigma28 factor (negative regulator of flagellin synthesis)